MFFFLYSDLLNHRDPEILFFFFICDHFFFSFFPLLKMQEIWFKIDKEGAPIRIFWNSPDNQYYL